MEEGGEGGFGRYEEKSTSSVIQSARTSPKEKIHAIVTCRHMQLCDNVHSNVKNSSHPTLHVAIS